MRPEYAMVRRIIHKGNYLSYIDPKIKCVSSLLSFVINGMVDVEPGSRVYLKTIMNIDEN